MPSTRPPDLVVFSDLDGTLLSFGSYDWAAAAPALETLAARGIPLVLASSKTRTEIRRWQERLRCFGPCISENGGALWIPAGWLPVAPADAQLVHGEWRIGFGVPYPALREALARIASALGVALRGFAEMSADEVAQRTGLGLEDARDAMARDYDEPFVPERQLTDREEQQLARLVAAEGLSLTRGGRFRHLLGGCSKGRAARRLLELLGQPGSVAVGDAENDLDLLQAADTAIVVARHDGSHDPVLRAALPAATFTRGIGPEGFTEGVLAALQGK